MFWNKKSQELNINSNLNCCDEKLDMNGKNH